jgi:hypothetical protein
MLVSRCPSRAGHKNIQHTERPSIVTDIVGVLLENHEPAREGQQGALHHSTVYNRAAVNFGGRRMSFAYKLNEDVHRQP